MFLYEKRLLGIEEGNNLGIVDDSNVNVPEEYLEDIFNVSEDVHNFIDNVNYGLTESGEPVNAKNDELIYLWWMHAQFGIKPVPVDSVPTL